jgi:hypothetical protein
MITTQSTTSREDYTTMSPRGGKRDPGPGKTIGRPQGTTGTGSGTKRKAIAISLQPDEETKLDAICASMGLNRSDFVRLAMRHAGVLAALKQEA